MKNPLGFVIFGSAFLFCSSCKSGLGPFQASPPDVVKAYYQNCNDGDYSKVDDLFSADSKKLVHGDLGAMAGGISGICNRETRSGTYTGLTIKSEEIRGEGALVIADSTSKTRMTR